MDRSTPSQTPPLIRLGMCTLHELRIAGAEAQEVLEATIQKRRPLLTTSAEYEGRLRALVAVIGSTLARTRKPSLLEMPEERPVAMER